MSDLSIGLLGMGEIARPIARYARAFDMRIRYWDIERFPELEARLGVEYLAWDDVFRQSDVLSLQLALNEHTEGIVGAREFALMKSSATFINTARGKLVDEVALVAALDAQTLRAAALDVYSIEPLPADSPLHDLHEDAAHRVILTPHSASHAPWTWVRDSQELWFNVRRVLDGETPKYLV
jgi:phosphoglycerate dehydrogenase-like enzyme